MPEHVQQPKAPAIEVTVDDDLDGMNDEEIAQERQMFQERAERVRRRVTMNQAFLPPSPTSKPENTRSN